MTGYGQAHFEDAHLRASVEVKTINAKQADISLRLPRAFSAQELAWRNLALAHLGRGKIAVTVTYERKDAALPTTHINQALFKVHYHTLQALAQEVGASSEGLFQLALQQPEVITKADLDTGHEAAEKILEKVLQEALEQCAQSRQAEGAVLGKQLLACLQTIKKGLKKIEALDPARGKTLRERLQAGVEAWVSTNNIDRDRLEQEVLYYLERLDIAEEEVRLAQHLAYFEEVMSTPQAVGKKLGFIAQEMGREINTIGAKANDAAIQKEVILMKEELEKIKEQLHNVL